jgi:hypothetical protein
MHACGKQSECHVARTVRQQFFESFQRHDIPQMTKNLIQARSNRPKIGRKSLKIFSQMSQL